VLLACVKDLIVEKDYRINDLATRQEYFDDWFAFMAEYGIFAGCVQLYFPEFAKRLNLSREQRFWWAWVNSHCQNACVTYTITRFFPDLPRTEEEISRLEEWYSKNWRRMEYDTDQRYRKAKLVSELRDYLSLLNGRTQEQVFDVDLADPDPKKYFRNVHDFIEQIKGWGRLTCWSGTEFYKCLADLPVEWDSFMMYNVDGSKSHRNGCFKSYAKDDLVWDKREPVFDEKNRPDSQLCSFAESLGWQTVKRLREKYKEKPWFRFIGPETVETAFCSYKNSFYGRRYVTVYCDMSYKRIKRAERDWPEVNYSIFWDIRRERLPKKILLEYNPRDAEICNSMSDLSKVKKAHVFKETGTPPMMSVLFPGKYRSSYDEEFLEQN